MIRIVNMTIGTSDPTTMETPVRRVSEKVGAEIDIYSFNSVLVESDPMAFDDLCRRSIDADLVIVRCVTDPDRFSKMERFCNVLSECKGFVYVHSSDTGVRAERRYLFKGTDEEFALLGAFVGNRGDANDEGIAYWLMNRLGMDVSVPEPVCQRPHGIYHPDFDTNVGFDEYMSCLDMSKPVVGILITGSQWIYGDLDHIDMLIRKLESAGMSTIPVFFNAGSNGGKNRMSDVYERYFMKDGRSLVRVIITNNPFSQLANSRNASGIRTSDDDNFYRVLTDVPVLQAMMVTNRFVDYEESRTSGDATKMMIQAAWTEMDGQILTVPISDVSIDPSGRRKNRPLEDRIDNLVRSVSNRVRISSKPRSERKVVIILYQYGEMGTIGGAAGLDSIESTANILRSFKVNGYRVEDMPETGRELADRLLSSVNNDLGCLSSEAIESMAPGLMDVKTYSKYYSELPQYTRTGMESQWGKPMGDVMTDKGCAVIPGIVLGNILVTVQPVRTWNDQVERMYHDPDLYPPHQYLAFYRWLRDEFDADAMIHVGTHGSLEWLPGKSIGLSSKCCPSFIQDGMINIYPYLIDDPGEGIQAKRRSQAVLIGHMCPTMTRCGQYDDIGEVDTPLQEYLRTPQGDREHRLELIAQILDACRRIDLLDDLNIPDDIVADEFESHLDDVHDYIMEVKDSLVRDGIHVLGRVPEGGKMDESIYSLTRIPNGDIPAFRDALAVCIGLDLNGIRAGEVPSTDLDELDSVAMKLIEDFRSRDYDYPECLEAVESAIGMVDGPLESSVRFICEVVAPGLKKMGDELESIIEALDGRYVLPGPSGAPTRGHADLLPMGRNYYSIDPDCIPTRSAWAIGMRMADQFIDKFVADKGAYPREVGFIVWATDTMKTDGDDIAYALWLMGVRPVWTEGGNRVVGLEPVPLVELGRPRIDTTVRISGLFRDAYPNLIELLDDAVQMVSKLDEHDQDNALAANLRRDITSLMSKGIVEDEAIKRASCRIFGCPPGCYGSGMNHAVDTGGWKDTKDLADLYAAWGSYAYGRGTEGIGSKEDFARNFARSQAVVKNLPDREIDMIDMDDVYGYLGGLNAFIKTYGRSDAVSYMGDSSDPERTTIRDTDDELKFVFRRKVLNPKFIEGLMEHGFRGVSEVSKMTDYIFGWDATSDIVEKWMYDGIAERYILDEKVSDWMKDENPFAMMDIVKRLMEAIGRGMWDADDSMRERLESVYMELEERIEDITDR